MNEMQKKSNKTDKILKVLGRERGLMVHCKGSEIYGLYLSADIRPEGFWRALLGTGRPASPVGFRSKSRFLKKAVDPSMFAC
jgi:hypothetical protein